MGTLTYYRWPCADKTISKNNLACENVQTTCFQEYPEKLPHMPKERSVNPHCISDMAKPEHNSVSFSFYQLGNGRKVTFQNSRQWLNHMYLPLWLGNLKLEGGHSTKL
jgi:hypothetical protein